MTQDTFPIRILSEKTGVPSATIRAWERRYNILPAQRTASGHRHYNEDDAVYVSHLVACMDQGMTISKAIREVDNQLQQGRTLTAQVRNTQSSQWQYYVDEMLLAVAQFNSERLNQTYQQAMALFAVDVVTEKVLCPTLVRLGQRWQERSAGIAEEHFFSAYLRNKIGARLHHHRSSNGTVIVMACVPGERHELGLLLFALYAQSKDYQVVYLGADLPLDQLVSVVTQTKASAVVLSSTADQLNQQQGMQLTQLTAEVDVPVMLGGNYKQSKDTKIDEIVMLGADFSVAVKQLDQLNI